MPLDGSLIAFAAKKLGVACATLFFDAALSAVPQVARYESAVTELAEAACSTENPDPFWVAAKVRTKFRFDIVWVTNGERLVGTKALTAIERTGAGGLDRLGFSGGPLLLSWRRYRHSLPAPATVTPSNFIKPAVQVAMLRDRDAATHISRCGVALWSRCLLLDGASPNDLAAWDASERDLAAFLAGRLAP